MLNVDLGYTHKPEALAFTPGAAAAVRRLNQAGYLVIVVTNQAGVARGLYDEAAVKTFHAAMSAAMEAEGARIDAYYYCPFHPQAQVEAYRHPDHPDRKPNPGMILQAMEDFGVDPAESFLIGDRDSDIEAARRAGIAGRLYTGGDLDALVQALLKSQEADGP